MLSEGRIKEIIRERDENRCTECGVTGYEYFIRTDWNLEVHRPKRGPYSMDNGVLVCNDCHLRVQKVWGRRMPRPVDARPVIVPFADAENYEMEGVAARLRVSLPCAVRAASLWVARNLARVEQEIAAVAAEIMDSTPDRRRPGRPLADPPPPEPKKRKGK